MTSKFISKFYFFVLRNKFTYYKQYLNHVNSTKTNNNNNREIKLKMCLFLYESFHLLYYSFCLPHHKINQIINFDTSTYLTSRNFFNIVCSVLFVQGIIFYKDLYLNCDPKLTNQLEMFMFQKLPKSLFPTNRHLITNKIRMFGFIFLYFLKWFKRICIYIILFVTVNIIADIIYLKINSFFVLTQFLFNLTIFTVSLVNHAHLMIIISILYLTLLFGHFLALKNLYKNLPMINPYNFNAFRQVFIKIFTSLMQLNKTLSKLFLIFIILNFPTNAFLYSWVVNDQKSSIHNRVLVVCFALHQNVCIFGFHFILGHFCKLLIIPGKAMCSIMVRQFGSGLTRSKIHVYCFINQNFVVRRYGFTYGANNSIITVKSFLKVSVCNF